MKRFQSFAGPKSKNPLRPNSSYSRMEYGFLDQNSSFLNQSLDRIPSIRPKTSVLRNTTMGLNKVDTIKSRYSNSNTKNNKNLISRASKNQTSLGFKQCETLDSTSGGKTYLFSTCGSLNLKIVPEPSNSTDDSHKNLIKTLKKHSYMETQIIKKPMGPEFLIKQIGSYKGNFIVPRKSSIQVQKKLTQMIQQKQEIPHYLKVSEKRYKRYIFQFQSQILELEKLKKETQTLKGFQKYIGGVCENKFLLRQQQIEFLRETEQKIHKISVRINKVQKIIFQRQDIRIQELAEMQKFLSFLHKKRRDQVIKACIFIQQQWRIQQKKYMEQQMAKLALILKDEHVCFGKLSKNITAMDSEVNDLHYKKVIEPIIPVIIKFQRMFRRSIERQKLKKQVHSLVVIARMYKAINQYELRSWWLEVKYKILNRMMNKNDYKLSLKQVKIQLKLQRLIEREKQRNKCKFLRLNFVAGILNRFYEKWHNTKSKTSALFQHEVPDSSRFFGSTVQEEQNRENEEMPPEVLFKTAYHQCSSMKQDKLKKNEFLSKFIKKIQPRDEMKHLFFKQFLRDLKTVKISPDQIQKRLDSLQSNIKKQQAQYKIAIKIKKQKKKKKGKKKLYISETQMENYKAAYMLLDPDFSNADIIDDFPDLDQDIISIKI